MKSKYAKRELEELWVKASERLGIPSAKGQAKTAAAIALAESGGVATAKNPEGPEHAEGLWQIKGQDISGNPLNPEVSALNAVAKWHAAGGFEPWTTFTGGQYKNYLVESGEEAIQHGNEEGPKGGSELGGLAEDLGIPGAGTIKSAGETLDSVGGFFSDLTKPSTWLRLAEGVGGIILFMVGLKTLTRGTPIGGATNVAIQQGRTVKGTIKSVAKKAAETAAVVAE